MIKRILGIGAGVAVAGVVGVLGYRHFVPAGPQSATAAPTATSSASKVITLGNEAETPVPSGRIKIAPVTPKQPLPKMSDLRPKPATTQPATQPAAAQPKASAQTSKSGSTNTSTAPGTPGSTAQQQIIKPSVKSPAKSPGTSTGTPAQPGAAKPQLAQPKPPTTQPKAPASQPTTPTTQPRAATKRKTISIQGDGQGDGASGGKLTQAERASISLLHQLHSLRSSIGLWKLRHAGEDLDFVANSGWEQLTRRDQAGQALSAAPVNPYNGCSRVLAVRDEPRPGQAVVGPFGFVYSTTSGKLWATDSNGRIFDDAAVDAVALEVRAVRELSPQEAERYLLAGLGAMRSQVALFALQHGDRTPDFTRYPAFEQLLKRTLADGRVVEGAGPGRSGEMFGPYILSMPVNPLNGKYKVKVLDGEVRPGQKIDWNEAGFVFSSAARRLYAVDANGCVLDDAKAGAAYLPKESGGAGAGAGAGPVGADPVQSLRSQVALYKLQHDDKLPDLKKYPRWEQLTSKTGADGTPDPEGKYGPYLFKTPVNSANGAASVAVVKSVTSYKPNPAVGFVFESTTGKVWLTDAQGNVVGDR